MTIEWLAGNRLRGTTAERPALGLPSGSVGGWKELARTTLDSTGNNIDVSSLPDKRYYMFLTHAPTDSTGYVLDRYRLNNDSSGTNGVSGNYSYRASLNGAADGTGTSQTEGIVLSNGASIHQSGEIFTMGYIANLSGKEKLLIGHTVHNDTAGSGTAPDRGEGVGKHAQTSNPVTSVNCVNTNNTGFASGSEMVVLGWDPADTHTTNFWDELASVELASASMRIDSGTFTAKKYLWIQIYNTAKPSGGNSYVYFNNVTSGETHSGRSNTNGRNPTNQSSQSDYQLTGSNGSIINHDVSSSGTATGMFTNMFVINNASKEKLSIVKSVSGWTNAGAGVAPAMFDCVGKWANTTDAITSVQCGSASVSTYMGAGSIIKVWGSD